jgi:RNA polymerase sigma factor (sigma-70 family)
MAAAVQAAFLELYTAHAARLHTYCLRLTGSPDDAADALQDTFTAVLARLEPGAAPIEHPKAYLYATARHACLRRLGERGRLEVVADVPEGEPDAGPSGGEQAVLTGELRAEVRAAHERLPARQREVLFLREVEELPYAEIADIMELTPNGAAQLAWRARAGLRGDLRHAALLAVAAAGDDCDRARTLLGLREDDALDPVDDDWLDEHLAECDRCRASRGLLLEAGLTYRAVLPIAALPFTAEEAFAHAAAAGASPGGSEGGSGGGSGGAAPPGQPHVPGRRGMAGAAAGAVIAGMLLLAASAETPLPDRVVPIASVGPPVPERTLDARAAARDAGDDDAEGSSRTRARESDAPAAPEEGDSTAAGEDGVSPAPASGGDGAPRRPTEVEARVPRPTPPRLTPVTEREPAAPPAQPVTAGPPEPATPPPSAPAALGAPPAPPAPPAPAAGPPVVAPPAPEPPPAEPPAAPACDSSHGNNGSSGPGSACEPCDRDDGNRAGNDEGPPVTGAALRALCAVAARPWRSQAPRPGAGAASRGR